MLTAEERTQLNTMKCQLLQMKERLTKEQDSMNSLPMDQVQPEAEDDLRFAIRDVSETLLSVEHLIDTHTADVDKLLYADLRTKQDVAHLTGDELLALRAQWFNRAGESGLIRTIGLIARYLGKSCGDRKTEWLYGDPIGEGYKKHAELIVYDDSYGGYLTVHYRGKQVMSTHSTDRLFVPGEWVRIIDEHTEAAIHAEQKYKQKIADQRRARLLSQLQ